jgi:hypothetical protein
MDKERQQKENSILRKGPAKRIILYALLILGSLILPVIVWVPNLEIVRNSAGKTYELTELFGFFASIGLIIVAYVELKSRKKALFIGSIPVILLLVVSFNYLFIITEFSAKSWDYTCYEKAAQAIAHGENPYGTHHRYLYPPLPGQAMAALSRTIDRVIKIPEFDGESRDSWTLVFYLYQCCQFLLIILGFYLSFRLLREGGLSDTSASLIVTVLFLFNNPLIRTLKYNQVNLWILDLILLALLLLRRMPSVAGLAIAVAGHIKLYPLIMLVPLALTRRFRAVAAAVCGLLAVILIQTDFLRDWSLWIQFFDYAKHFPRGTLFRDNSIHSIMYNTFRFIGHGAQPDKELLAKDAGAATIVVSIILIAWFVIRYIERERLYSAHKTDTVVPKGAIFENSFRLQGHLVDAIALMLLLSPMVWEHHYVFAMPVILLAVILIGRRKPAQVAICAFLMLGLPTFDVFPFSYHRIAGLLMLLYLLKPSRCMPGIDEQAQPHVSPLK